MTIQKLTERFLGSSTAKVLPVVLFLCVLLCVSVETAAAASLTSSKKAGSYVVGIRIDRNPPIIGENNLEIEIRDAGGRAVSDARVLVNYYMPPMPRMAPMNYRTDAKFRGGKYRTTMHIIMEGPWVIAVKVTLAGKTSTARFNIDAK